jgi:hypothetical protein
MLDAQLPRDDVPSALNRRDARVPGDSVWFIPGEADEFDVANPISAVALPCRMLRLNASQDLMDIDEVQETWLAAQGCIANGRVRVETGDHDTLTLTTIEQALYSHARKDTVVDDDQGT